MSTTEIFTIILAAVCFLCGYSMGRVNGFKEAMKMVEAMSKEFTKKKEN